MSNNQQVIALFYDDSSARAINTWVDPKDEKPNGPASIVRLCKEAGLNKCVFISSAWYSFISALKLCEKENIQLIFGLEILMCPDRHEKSDESVKQNHKIIVFAKNSAAYKDLIKLYSSFKTDKEAKYYEYRCDDKLLNEYWTDNLSLALPFFSSFVAKNLLTHGANIIPKFPTKELTIFREVETDHPHENLINYALDNFCANEDYEQVKCKSVFYEKKEDIQSATVFRGIHNKSTYHTPNLDYFCSDAFNFSAWRELN